MNEFILMTDSTVDMPESFIRENQIPCFILTYTRESYTYILRATACLCPAVL